MRLGGCLRRAIVAAAIAAGVAPATAAAETLHVARDADRIVVTGTGLRVGASLGHAGAELNVGIQQGQVSVGAGCHVRSQYSATCASDGIRLVVVRFGDGSDSLTVSGSGVPLDVDLGGGSDFADVLSPLEDRIDGGSGGDTIGHYRRTAGVVARLDGAPGGEDRLAGFETLVGSPHDDVLVGGPGVDTVSGSGGSDRIDVRGGGSDFVWCGGDDRDSAHIDAGDHATDCASVVYGPADAAPIVRSPHAFGFGFGGLFASPRRASSTGLVATPTFVDGGLLLVVKAPAGASATGVMAVAPWRAPADVTELPTASADAGAGGVATLRMALPPAAAAALAADGRLRTRLALRIRRPDGRTTGRTGVITVVTPRPWGQAVTGTRRRGGFGPQRLVGTPNADLLLGMSADDRLFGGAGDDRLLGGTGNDALAGQDGRDALDGGDGDDFVLGGPGDDDMIEQRFGRDRLAGEDGDDVIFGGRGEDVLFGGPGDDVLAGGSGPDVVDCGPGEDIVFINFAGERWRVHDCEEIHLEAGVVNRPCSVGGTDGPETLLGTAVDDVCRGLAGDDDLEGAAGDDLLAGGAGNDRLFGRFGADRLDGGAGDDELEGGRDADLLVGGSGDDRMNGGFAADVLRAGPGRDRVIARGGGTDRIDCGAGSDVAWVDSRDRVRGCERVHRSGPRRR